VVKYNDNKFHSPIYPTIPVFYFDCVSELKEFVEKFHYRYNYVTHNSKYDY